MRIAIVTDAWSPQVNGVVRTLKSVRRELEATGHQVLIISPAQFASMPCPTYPEIRLAMVSPRAIGRLIGDFQADAIHLATEGPLCLAARTWCLRRAIPFTTAYHTNFPDYVQSRTGLSADWFWPYFRWFHGPASAVLTSTPSIRTDLENAGADVVDEEVVVDGNLITSRKPDDIPAFNKAIIAALEEELADEPVD